MSREIYLAFVEAPEYPQHNAAQLLYLNTKLRTEQVDHTYTLQMWKEIRKSRASLGKSTVIEDESLTHWQQQRDQVRAIRKIIIAQYRIKTLVENF